MEYRDVDGLIYHLKLEGHGVVDLKSVAGIPITHVNANGAYLVDMDRKHQIQDPVPHAQLRDVLGRIHAHLQSLAKQIEGLK